MVNLVVTSLNPATSLTHGLMQGGGFYNRHASHQAAGIAAVLPILARAAAKTPIEPLVLIADYGSSQGRNSLNPLRVAIESTRTRAPEMPIQIMHIDQPGNDFASLFRLLEEDGESYLRTHRGVYGAAMGRSFFDQVLPAGSVTLGWSSFAAQWLSHIPVEAPDHIVPHLTSPEQRRRLEAQSDEDWRTFLAHRARELRPGGRLVVVVPGLSKDSSSALAPMMSVAKTCLSKLAESGRITSAELSRMFIPAFPKTQAQLRAPFAGGSFEDLVLEEEDLTFYTDLGWEKCQRDGDRHQLADGYLHFFQATFQPSLLRGLDPDCTKEQRDEVASALAVAIREAVCSGMTLSASALHTIVAVRR